MAITPGGCYRQDHRLYYVRRSDSFGKVIAMTVLSDLKPTKKFLSLVSSNPKMTPKVMMSGVKKFATDWIYDL